MMQKNEHISWNTKEEMIPTFLSGPKPTYYKTGISGAKNVLKYYYGIDLTAFRGVSRMAEAEVVFPTIKKHNENRI